MQALPNYCPITLKMGSDGMIIKQCDMIRDREEHTSELQSRETISYAVFCLKKKKKKKEKEKEKKKKKKRRLTESHDKPNMMTTSSNKKRR